MRAELADPEIAHERRWATLLVLCLSLMVIGLDNTILNVAIPTLAHPVADGGLGASASQLQWIVDSYTLVFAGLLLTAGSLGDRYGRYRGLTIGLVVFASGSIASAFAPSAAVLIGTRALMGIGGALIMPSTLSILTNVFHDPFERAKAIGIWAGVSALGIGFGPLAGGILLSHFWWGSVFLVNVPIVVLALVAGFRFVPESRDPAESRLDPTGSLLSIVGLGALLWAVIEGPELGWGSTPVLAGFAVGLVVLVAFFWWELHTDEPMLNLHFFENPRFSAASAAIMLTFFALFGTIFVLTQYLQLVLGFSPVKAGALLVPQAGVLMIFAPLAPRRVERFGTKYVVSAGLGVVALSLVLMTGLTTTSPAIAAVGVTMVLGLGMAHIMAPATESIMGSLPREKAGVGSAMNDTTRQVGGAVGVAVLGSILSSRYTSELLGRLPASVPPQIAEPVSESIGAALGIARDVPAAAAHREAIVSAANTAFVDGMHVTVVAAAVVIVIAAIGVLRWLPARGHDHVDLRTGDRAEVPLGVGPVDVVPADVAADVGIAVDEAHER